MRIYASQATSCQDLTNVGNLTNGVYTIIPDDQGPLKVYCDQTTDGGGWAILQRRVFPFNTSFTRSWEDYRTGFGNLTGEFWVGTDNIHRLAATPVSFRVEFHEGGKKLYAKYENFVVAGAEDKYRWNMDSYSGTLPNAMYGAAKTVHRHTGMQFSTPDEDNDGFPGGSCAGLYGNGWWFNHCALVNLNEPPGPRWADPITDPYDFLEASHSEMKVRKSS